MSKDDLWRHFIKKNTHWVEGGASFTAVGLKRFYDTVFDQAHDLGFRNGKAHEQMHGSKKNDDNLGDLFGGILSDMKRKT